MPHNSPGPIDLTAIFGRFAGQEILFTKTPWMPAEPAKDQNPVLEDLLPTAESHGLRKYRIQPHFDIG